MASILYTRSPAPIDKQALVSLALSGRDTIARLAQTIALAHEQLTAGDPDLADLTLRTELASPLLSGGVFYG